MAAAGYLAFDLMHLEHRVRRLERRVEVRARREEAKPFELHDDVFISKYRISPDDAWNIVEELEPFLERQRPYGLSVEAQVLTALRFYATGCYQDPNGDTFDIPMSQPSVSRCVRTVSQLLNDQLLRRTVRFPMTPDERMLAKRKFSLAPQPFQNTIGAIDCTYINILSPKTHEEAYVNHWGDHSLNVQVIGDPDYKILNVNPRYPGARNDYFIWTNSAAKRVMERQYENGERNTWLIADDGYFIEPWLMTPLKHEQVGTARFQYNDALCSARSVVERLFGLLKSVFRCLSAQRKLMYDPTMAGKIVNACAVLHNIRIDNRIEDVAIDPAELAVLRQANLGDNEERVQQNNPMRYRAVGERIQAGFINRVFQRQNQRLGGARE